MLSHFLVAYVAAGRARGAKAREGAPEITLSTGALCPGSLGSRYIRPIKPE